MAFEMINFGKESMAVAPLDAVAFNLIAAIFIKSGFSMNSSSIPDIFVFFFFTSRVPFGFLTNNFAILDLCNSCLAVSERPIKIPKNCAGFEERPLSATVAFMFFFLSSAAFAAKNFFFLIWKSSSLAFSQVMMILPI